MQQEAAQASGHGQQILTVKIEDLSLQHFHQAAHIIHAGDPFAGRHHGPVVGIFGVDVYEGQLLCVNFHRIHQREDMRQVGGGLPGRRGSRAAAGSH